MDANFILSASEFAFLNNVRSANNIYNVSVLIEQSRYEEGRARSGPYEFKFDNLPLVEVSCDEGNMTLDSKCDFAWDLAWFVTNEGVGGLRVREFCVEFHVIDNSRVENRKAIFKLGDSDIPAPYGE